MGGWGAVVLGCGWVKVGVWVAGGVLALAVKARVCPKPNGPFVARRAQLAHRSPLAS